MAMNNSGVFHSAIHRHLPSVEKRLRNERYGVTLRIVVKIGHALLGVAVGLFTFSALAGSADPVERRVLMIGNSFSICVGHEMPQIAQAMGLKLTLGSLYIGGCTLEKHWQNWVAQTNVDYRPYLYEVYVDGRKRTRQVNIPEALDEFAWDVVTFQQASHLSWKPQSYQPFADNLQAGVGGRLPRAEFVWQETWSYTPWHWDFKYWKFDQNGMYERLHKAYVDIAASKGQRIIPTGTAVQLWRKRLPVVYREDSLGGDVVGRNTTFERQPDGTFKAKGDLIHLNRAGEYLQALVWTAKIFGVDVRKCPYVPGYVTPQSAELMKQVAMEAVATAGEITGM